MYFGPSPTVSVYRAFKFGPSDTDYRSIEHQSIGPSDTGTSVHRTPRPKNSPRTSSCFPTYQHPLTRARDLNWDLTLLTSTTTRRLKRGLCPLGALYGPSHGHNTTPPLRGLRPLPAQTQPTRHTPTRNTLRASPDNQKYRAAALGGGKMDRVTTPVAALYPTLKKRSA